MKEFWIKFKVRIIEGAMALVAIMASIFFFTKFKNNSTLEKNKEAGKEVDKLEGKVDLLEDQAKEEDKAIADIKEEVKNETAQEKTTKELADFFDDIVNRK